MEKRQLGSDGPEITSIGLGTWGIGGWMWGGQDRKDSLAAFRAALDSGVNWIDTAPIYGSGESERSLGEFLKEIPAKERPFIFSKFGLGDDTEKIRKSASAAEILAECEQSLSRLGVECIDLYQLHWPVEQSMEEVAGACDTLLGQGKIRSIGVCNFSVEQLNSWVATGVPLTSVQNPYSILRVADEEKLLPWCSERNIGYLAYSSLLRGMLFGLWGPEKTFPEGDARATHADYQGERFQRHLAAMESLTELGRPLGLSCAQISLGTILAEPGCSAAIVGARSEKQGGLLGSLHGQVDSATRQSVRDIISALQRDLEK